MEIDLMEFIVGDALIIVPALWVLGVFLKKSTVKDKFIVWVLLVVGTVLTMGIMGLSVEAVIQGILVTGAAVLGHQLLKQTVKKE